MNTVDPIPANFGLAYVARYMLWYAWSNPVSILCTVQAVFQALTLPNPDTGQPMVLPLSHSAVHWIAIANLVLIVVIAQIRKRLPFNPPPTKAPTP